MKHPNSRYGHPAELSYWRFGLSDKDLAKTLHRSENTVKKWRTGQEKIPFWVPELLRLRHYEYQNRMRLMGIGEERARLGRVKADVIDFGKAQTERTTVIQEGSPQGKAMALIQRQNRVTSSPYFKI